jgi:hypothetical protein
MGTHSVVLLRESYVLTKYVLWFNLGSALITSLWFTQKQTITYLAPWDGSTIPLKRWSISGDSNCKGGSSPRLEGIKKQETIFVRQNAASFINQYFGGSFPAVPYIRPASEDSPYHVSVYPGSKKTLALRQSERVPTQ